MSTKVAKRLRTLQSAEGITIQQMADRCGLSKASLANYMRTKEPQRPGFDAIVAIAKGMNVSTDWLAGLTSDPTPSKDTEHSDALLVFSVVTGLLVKLEQLQKNQSEHVIGPGNLVAGKPLWYHSAKSMLNYLEMRKTPLTGTEEDCVTEVDNLIQAYVADKPSQ